MTAPDWLARTDWRRRPAELGELAMRHEHVEHVATAPVTDLDPDSETATLWRALPRHPHLLELGAGNLMRYAALDWDAKPDLATLGIEVTRAFELVLVSVPPGERGPLTCPRLYVDLEGRARVGFAQPDASAALAKRVPPEVIEHWPRCDERGLVFCVGQLLLSRVAAKSPVIPLLKRCLERDPALRYRTIAELRSALTAIGGRRDTREPSKDWVRVERGIGMLYADAFAQASWQFAAAGEHPIATAALAELRAAKRVSDIEPPWYASIVPWEILVAQPALSSDPPEPASLRRWRILRTDPGLVDVPPLTLDECLATARRFLANQELGPAIDFAQRALAIDPSLVEMRELVVASYLRIRRGLDALAAADAWIAVDDSVRAQYLRGKALLACGRLAEARATLDLVRQRQPGHTAAMFMLIELSRRMSRTRVATGVDRTAPPPLPAHLATAAALISEGRTEQALAALRAIPDDAEATRLLAGYLAFLRRTDEALAAYRSISDNHGEARCLVDLGRPDEALAMLARDDSSAALAIAADALDALGRTGEANAALAVIAGAP